MLSFSWNQKPFRVTAPSIELVRADACSFQSECALTVEGLKNLMEDRVCTTPEPESARLQSRNGLPHDLERLAIFWAMGGAFRGIGLRYKDSRLGLLLACDTRGADGYPQLFVTGRYARPVTSSSMRFWHALVR